MKLKFNSPGTKRLKLMCDMRLSKYAFKFNLRGYIKGVTRNKRDGEWRVKCKGRFLGTAVQVDPMKPNLKSPGNKHLILQCDRLLSTFAFKFDLRRYTLDSTPRRRLRRGRITSKLSASVSPSTSSRPPATLTTATLTTTATPPPVPPPSRVQAAWYG